MNASSSQNPGSDAAGAPLSGIDPALVPYLEAADADTADLDAQETAESERKTQAAIRDEQADYQALRTLVAHNMIATAAVEELDELLADAEDDAEDVEAQVAAAQHEAALRRAAHEVEVNARVREIETEIFSRAPEHKVQPSLERVKAVLDLIGNPERTYPVVHITGTNGKTSTARMTERLLSATGLKTGRFTSPHLASIRERISLDGEPISAPAFIAAWEDVAPYIAMVDERSQAHGGVAMSFFEVLTVMALAVFADYPIDVAIIEVGMGGTWDATNVVDAAVAVITPIGRDHQAWLGDTIAQIAANKAGIIKDGATLITAVQPPAAQAVIAASAKAHGVIWRQEVDETADAAAESVGQLRVEDRTLAVGGQMVTLVTAAATYADVFIPLYGEYQAHNALLALAASEAIFAGRALPAKVVEDGFAAVTSPGRLEVVRSSPTVIVDAGHNPHAIEALLDAVEETFGFSHLVVVFGVMADKDVEGILSILEPRTQAIVVVPLDSPRAMAVEDLAELSRQVYGSERVVAATDLLSGVEQAVNLSEQFSADAMTSSGVLIVGSVVLAAQARALFNRH